MEEEQDGADIQRKRRYTRVQYLPRHQTNVPLYDTMGTINRGEATTKSIGNTQYGFRPGKSTTESILNTANSPGEIQRDEQRAPHGLRGFGEGIRPSTP